MKKVFILTALVIVLSSCHFKSSSYTDEDIYKETSDPTTISKILDSKIIFDAKTEDDIIWSFHPYIKNCFYNKDKEIYLYHNTDTTVMVVDYKYNIVHNFNKEESKSIMLSIHNFEYTMHNIEMGKLKNHISK